MPYYSTLRRPLVGIALAAVSGMMIAATGLFSFGMLLFAALGCIVLGGLLIRTRASVMLVFCGVALVSACRFMVAAAPLSRLEISRLQPQLPMDNVQIAGRVLEPPEYHAYRSGDLGFWVFTLECEGMKTGGAPLAERQLLGSWLIVDRDNTAESGDMCNSSRSINNPTTINQSGTPPTTNNLTTINQSGTLPTTNNPATINQSGTPPTTNNPTTINQSGTPRSTINQQPINQSCAVWLAQRGRIQVRVTGAPPEKSFRQGTRIRFSGILRRRAFPGGASVELVAPASGGWEILSGSPRFSPLIWGQRLREGAARTLSNGIEKSTAQLAVYKALLLGYRKAIPSEIHQQFKRTGTLHIFAISGLHVGIVGLLITVVLKTIGIPRDRWGLILLPLLLGYVVATGMKSSALRALTMAAVYFLSPLFRRQPDIPVSIAFAAILLLFWKPLEILSAGFIFSFTVVSFIVMLFAMIPKEFIFRGAGWLRSIRTYGVSLGITSMAASIASAPLTALFFGAFTLTSLVGNLIVVPLTFCIVLSGWLSILVPPASGIFNHAALVFINGLLGTVGFLSDLPGAYVQVPPPPLMALLFWYSGWIHLFVHARSTRQRTASFVLISLAIALTVLSSISLNK